MQREEQAAFQGYIDASRGIEPPVASFWHQERPSFFYRHAGKLGLLIMAFSMTSVVLLGIYALHTLF